ncbi:MAG: glycosyltransferase family 9 protein [Pyrinomonadaceae bacterium]|nr:glycosyltransferase family 9 protein [Phycisphaerales bacterium]
MPSSLVVGSPPRRILVIRPSALGDVCRTVPVLASLKRAYPGASIDWMVQQGFEESVAHHPDVSGVVLFPRKRFSKWWTPEIARELLGWLGELRRAKYDLVVDCQGLARSGFFAWATRAKIRIGYADAAEGGWLGVNRRVKAAGTLHTVDRMLALVESAGALVVRDMRLYSPADAWQRLLASEGAARLTNGRFAVIAPTSRWPGKLWPAERYAEAARILLGDKSIGIGSIAIVGAGHERDQCRALTDLAAVEPRVVDLIGKTTIGTLMALVERSSLVIANDSACLHMAVGFDRPLVGLYGPTDVSLVGPYQREGCVVQRLVEGDTFDHKNRSLGEEMMRRISVEDVMEKVREVLGRTERGL